MGFKTAIIAMILTFPGGCSYRATTSSTGHTHQTAVLAWPDDWDNHVGQTVTVEGMAGNAQLGAVLQCADDAVWIDGMDYWPEAISGAQGKRVRVTGMVIRRDDIPAFVRKDGEPQQSGAPVRSESELPNAKRRYLLANVAWKLID